MFLIVKIIRSGAKWFVYGDVFTVNSANTMRYIPMLVEIYANFFPFFSSFRHLKIKISFIYFQIDDDEDGDVNNGDTTTTKCTRINPTKNPNYVPVQPVKRRKYAKAFDRQDELISLACEHLQKPEDEFLIMAKAWAIDLSKMDPEQLLLAKKKINDIIFEGLSGNLHRPSVKINAITQETRCWKPGTNNNECVPMCIGAYSKTQQKDYSSAIQQQYMNIVPRDRVRLSRNTNLDSAANSADGMLDAKSYFSNFIP